jgi:light-regulated signal transduction histidine kinase (bacteriophytochrome)
MMGYKSVHCESLKQKNSEANSTGKDFRQKRKEALVNDLVDPICIIANANEMLYLRLGKFVDSETRDYFEMITRAITKTKTLVDELRQETN